MVFLSLAQREMSAASRKRRLWFVRLIVAVAFFLVILVRLADPAARVDGTKLFETMSWMAFVYCLFAGAFRACDSLAEEKREGTLGLLLLTDLSPPFLLLGKILSATATTFFGLLAILPMLALPILMGGVSGAELLRVWLSLLNALFLSTSWGFFISAIARKHVATTLLAFLIPIFFGGVVLLVLLKMESDLMGFQVCLWCPTVTQFASFYPDKPALRLFWNTLGFNHVLAWGFFCLAAMLFPRRWQEAAKNAAAERWQKRVREWRYGAPQERRVRRRRMLRGNPIIWFVNRDRFTSVVLVVLCAAMFLVGHLVDADLWTLLAVNIIVLFRVANEASHTVSKDQKSGALELLLSTRLTVREIIQGRVYALLRQFGAVIALIVGWQFAVLTSRTKDHADLAVTLTLWLPTAVFTLAWVGPWFALRAKRPAAATWMTLAVVILPPLIGWIGAVTPSIFDSSLGDIHIMAATVCTGIGAGHCCWLFLWARRMLFVNFRAAVEDRFVIRRFEPILSGFEISASTARAKFSNCRGSA